ncbi:MAG: hypothetical protein AB8G22_21220, partial [Saprospiraceae bacterium]
MRKAILLMLAIIAVFSSCHQEQQPINSLKTFAKAYGYVKYFHPSDEATQINWNQFAAYGAEQITECKNKTEVVQTLNKLFQPIAPSVVFSEKLQTFDPISITPRDTTGYRQTYWQHHGVSKDMSYQNYVYNSLRVNSFSEIDESSSYGNLSLSLDHKQLAGKEIKYTGWVKLKQDSKGTGHLWLRVNKPDKSIGFFENMDANPIKSTEWQQYEIIGNVDENPSQVLIGSYLNGKGTLLLDDLHVYYKEQGEWVEISVSNSDFEKELEEEEWEGNSEGYTYQLNHSEFKEGQQALEIAYQGKIKKIEGEAIFEEHPALGEIIEEEIGEGVFCQIPLSLYTKDAATYPKSTTFESFQAEFEQQDFNSNSLAMRLGNVINTYDVLQHFYPYFGEVEVNWEKELEQALSRSFTDTSLDDHIISLQKMMATLKDGHAKVWLKGTVLYVLPIQWEWIEDKLVITELLEEISDLKVGDIITQINGQSSHDYFKEIFSRISAGNEGSLTYKGQLLSTEGEQGDTLTIEVNNQKISLNCSVKYNYTEPKIAIQTNLYKQLENNIYYLNLHAIEMDTIIALLPQLKEAKGIICDM